MPSSRLSGYGKLLHGEAWPSACAAPPGWPSGWAASMRNSSNGSKNYWKRSACPSTVPNLDREKILEAMQHDKKVQHGNLKFVLPNRMGHVESVGEIDQKEIAALETVAALY